MSPIHIGLKADTQIRSYEANPSRRFNLTEVGTRSSAAGHAALVAALKDFFHAGHDMAADPQDDDIAEMIRETASMQRRADFTMTDIAAAHVVIIHGALVSAVPTVFWAVVYVFSNPKLLEQVRRESLAAVKLGEGSLSGKRELLITTDRLETLYPVSMSILREMQRLSAVGTLHRRVLEDTELSEGIGQARRTYLLKKGTAVFLPVFPCHRNQEIWGDDPDKFNLSRFQKEGTEASSAPPLDEKPLREEKSLANLRKKAYFPFGGGKELCPGRHLAVAEALTTLAVLTLGFDITSPDGSTLNVPPIAEPKLTSQTARPHEKADLRARVSIRPGWEDIVWGVNME